MGAGNAPPTKKEKEMKALKIIAIVGNLVMLAGCIFLIINLSLDKTVFPDFVTLPMMLIGIVGNICALINNKRK